MECPDKGNTGPRSGDARWAIAILISSRGDFCKITLKLSNMAQTSCFAWSNVFEWIDTRRLQIDTPQLLDWPDGYTPPGFLLHRFDVAIGIAAQGCVSSFEHQTV